ASTQLARARSLEAALAPIDARRAAWERAIAVWAVVATWDVFWELFPVERATAYKRAIAPADARAARDAVSALVERLLAEHEGQHHDAGRVEDAAHVARIRDAFEAERATARAMADVMRLDGGKHFAELPFPCGPLALDLLGVRAEVIAAVRVVAKRAKNDASV